MKDLDQHNVILVTGGAGYVGSRCVTVLGNQGFRVRAVDKVSPEKHGIVFPAGIEFIKGDLRDAVFARRALEGARTVLHLAANIGPLSYMQNHEAGILQENAAIDAVFYDAAIASGKPCIVYSSSSMVFQHSPVYPYCESDLWRVSLPTNIYGMSKLIGEYFCRAYAKQYGLPFVILRYHNIYGPGEDSKGSAPGDIHVIPALIEKTLSGQYPLELLGGERATRPFTYIDDAVLATVAVILRAHTRDPNVIGEDFNIGPREATRIVDVAHMVWKIAGDERPFQYVVKETSAITAERREMVSDKIERVIGWRPQVSLRDGIIKTTQWISERNVKFKNQNVPTTSRTLDGKAIGAK